MAKRSSAGSKWRRSNLYTMEAGFHLLPMRHRCVYLVENMADSECHRVRQSLGALNRNSKDQQGRMLRRSGGYVGTFRQVSKYLQMRNLSPTKRIPQMI